MKRVTLLMIMLAATVAYAQKPVKPSTSKILSLWKDGKLAEAKEVADVTVTGEKTSTDGKAWYYRGLVYASLDTTSNASFKSLANQPLATAIESFAKADQLGKAGSEYFISDPSSVVPVTKSQQLEVLCNYYLNKGINFIQQDEPDYEASIASLEKTALVSEKAMKTYSNDTLTYYVLALAAQNSDNYDKAIEACGKYFAKGGNSKDAYIMLYQIYNGPKENKEKALEVVREAKAKIPGNSDFPRLEIGLLIDLNRVGEAKTGLEAAVAKEPNDKILHFYLAYANASLKNKSEAIKHYNAALRIDPNYFEAQYYLSQLFLIDVDAVSKEINNLGISAADDKKKRELFTKRVTLCEEAIPYLEKAEKMKAPDRDTQIDVLEKLSMMYYYVADDAKEKVVRQKLKQLGVED
ncbi:MAG: tetratricopeptide repeat protein [Cyclobacteriaceae bacterium]|nr:tetratricopeptide repeat protein [Cyclobacteriaceae bacterium]